MFFYSSLPYAVYKSNEMIKNLRVESYALWILIFLTIFFQGLYRERKRSLEEKTRENKPCEEKKSNSGTGRSGNRNCSFQRVPILPVIVLKMRSICFHKSIEWIVTLSFLIECV